MFVFFFAILLSDVWTPRSAILEKFLDCLNLSFANAVRFRAIRSLAILCLLIPGIASYFLRL